MSVPLVTVLVPARDEQSDIGGCIEAIARQDHPSARLEVIIIDGGSTDGTAAVADGKLSDAHLARFEVISNPTGTTPSNLNAGLKSARGDVVCRVDARSRIPADYVSTCVETLSTRPNVAVVGGSQRAIAPCDGPIAKGIARALNNPLGMGLSRYRRGASSGPADTVYLGAFRTEQLRTAGGWSEVWTTNQDFELNRRMARSGDIWFEAEIAVDYVPRRTLGAIWRQYHRFGRWKARYWRQSGDRPRSRQLVLIATPLIAVLGLLVALAVASRPVVLAAVIAAASLALGFETLSAGPEAGPRARLVSIVASVLVAGGWWTGVLRELARWPR